MTQLPMVFMTPLYWEYYPEQMWTYFVLAWRKAGMAANGQVEGWAHV